MPLPSGFTDRSLTADYYQALFEHAGDGIFISDDKGEYLVVNPAGHALLGYSMGELVGRHVADVIAATESSKFETALSRVREGTVLVEDYRFVRKDGTTFEGEVKGQRLPDGRLLGVVRDVTERARAEQRIRASESLLRSVLDTALDVILTIDRDGRIVFINRVMPYQTPAEVVGAPCIDFVTPEQRPRVAAAVEHVFATGQVDEYETESPSPSGKSEWFYVRVGPVVEDDQVKAVTMCATNITRRKRAEEARAKLEMQLRQTQKEEGIGRLAGGVAHDFNNLLTSILGFASLAQRSLSSGSPSAQFLQEIVLCAQRGASLTQQLLAFARQKVVKPEVTSLNGILTRLQPMLERLIGEDVDLKLELSQKGGLVKVDVGSIEQVVLNLAVNARDAMPRGGALTIKTEDLASDGPSDHASVRPIVVMSVTDTGSGMTPEVLERVFEPFYTTKPTGEGTGLGLSMCQGIVRQAGGRIAVTSAPGQGTTFRIYLPSVAGKPVRAAQAAAEPSVLRGTETVLLVEDDASILSMSRHALTNLGYHVLTACDGGDALEVLARSPLPIDLVVTDVVMPHIGGQELAARLSQLTPTSRVLFTSGYLENTMATQGVVRDGLHFLQKPYTPAALAVKIRALLDRAD